MRVTQLLFNPSTLAFFFFLTSARWNDCFVGVTTTKKSKLQLIKLPIMTIYVECECILLAIKMNWYELEKQCKMNEFAYFRNGGEKRVKFHRFIVFLCFEIANMWRENVLSLRIDKSCKLDWWLEIMFDWFDESSIAWWIITHRIPKYKPIKCGIL